MQDMDTKAIQKQYVLVVYHGSLIYSNRFQFNGTNNCYYEFSNSSDPQQIFVCVHGLARNACDFHHLAAKITSTHDNTKVVSIDMPGRGKSDWLQSGSDYSYPYYLKLLPAFVAEVNPNKLPVC